MRRLMIPAVVLGVLLGVQLSRLVGDDVVRDSGAIGDDVDHAAVPAATTLSKWQNVTAQFAESASVEELQHELAVLEAKLAQIRARQVLDGISSQLEELVQKYPQTEAATAAGEMLKRKSLPQRSLAPTADPISDFDNFPRRDDEFSPPVPTVPRRLGQ